MKLRLILFIFLPLQLSAVLFAQVDREQSELEEIYENLEYKTIAFDDLKKNWLIKDPILTREIFNRLVVNNAVYENGAKVKLSEVKKKAELIYDDLAYVELKQRYYDKEIESLKFFTEDQAEKKPEERVYLFDPLEDCIYIREVMGDRVYNMIQEKTYGLSDITKDYFESNVGYYFDIYFHALDGEIMFWNTTSGYKNKYLVSVFEKWGNDFINIPGWNFNDIVTGIKLSYTDRVKKDRATSYYLYNIQIGSGMSAKRPLDDVSKYDRDFLYNSGSNVYFKLSGNPLFFLKVKYFQLGIEGLVNLEDKAFEDYDLEEYSMFYSMKNYYVLSAKQTNIFNLFDFGEFELGAGAAMHDMYHYTLNPDVKKVLPAEPLTPFIDYKYFYGEMGVSREGGLLQHNLTLNYSMSPDLPYGWASVKAMLMISNTIGLDFRYFLAVGDTKQLPSWQADGYYIVFSPILRIVY